MIDPIIGLILKEARGRPGKDMRDKVYEVMQDLDATIIKIFKTARDIERRKEENEKER